MAAEGYDPTRKLSARPPNWGIAEPSDLRVEVTGSGGTAAIVTVNLEPDGETVKEARFKSRGVTDCLMLLARAIRVMEGNTLASLVPWRAKQIADAIGESPVPMSGPARDALDLALLAFRNILHQAGADRPGQSGRSVAVAEVDKTVCYCMDVSEGTILDAIRNRNCTTVDQITAKTGAVGGCGTCRPDVQELLAREGVTPGEDDPTAPYRQNGPPWGAANAEVDGEIDLRDDTGDPAQGEA